MKKWIMLLCLLALAVTLSACGCKHENQTREGALAATCTEDGFTGSMICGDCGETLASGVVIPAYGHENTETRLHAREASCTNPGYSGDVYCLRCLAMVSEGSELPLGDHLVMTYRDDEAPTCESEGYRAGRYCEDCGITLSEEEYIPALGHNIINPDGYIAPSCTREGFQGEGGCANCNEYVVGDEIDRLEHNFGDDNICTECQWPRAGLYDENFQMVMTWDELMEKELVGNTYGGSRDINYIHESLTGTLVVEEDYEIYLRSRGYTNDNMPMNVSVIYTPCTQNSFYDEAFAYLPNLKEVRIFGHPTSTPWQLFQGSGIESIVLPDTIETLGYKTFAGCSNLTGIEIPDSVIEIGEQCFWGCSGLTEITTPSSLEVFYDEAFRDCTSLKKVTLNGHLSSVGSDIFKDCTSLEEVYISEAFRGIGERMFSGCTALESIELPEGLTTVFGAAFEKTSITELEFPSTMNKLPHVGPMEMLERLDLSACVDLTTVPEIYDCPALYDLMLPPNAVNFDSRLSLSKLPSLKRLVLPDNLTGLGSYFGAEAVEEIVWPVSLQDAGAMKNMAALSSILYRGSEEEWNSVSGNDMFPNASVLFDYTGY